MKLVIAEKPSVAKSIASALGVTSGADGFYQGNDLIVSWCVGHLVSPMDAGGYDERYKKWHYDDLPIVPEPFRYVVLPNKEAAFENLRTLMNRPDVDTIVNACDAGREGELIFRLVYEMAGCTKPTQRLWISSMEDSAIREGFRDLRPGAEYDSLYHSALCRQKADWLVGINATRLFSVLYHRTLNVGRVQTPTLAMLVERDGKIILFKKEKYHHVRLNVNGIEAVSEKFADLAQAEKVKAACADSPIRCVSVQREQKKELPPKLYDLTTLQREANRIFGYTAKQTLDYAQSLYEKKLLTYPRTDSRYLTSDMAETVSCVIHLAAKVPPFAGCSNFFPMKDDFGNPYEEWFISDYDCYVGNLYDKLGEYESLDELNYLAAKLDDMDRYEYNQFLAAMEMGDHCRNLQEIINLTENLDCYEVYSGIEDYDDLGRYYIEELDVLQVPEHLKNYIDYEAYGRDIAIDENGSFTEFGYVRDTGSSFHEYYDGDRSSIPDEYRVMTFQDDLPEEEKSEWAMDIAFDLDEFFRQHDPKYAADHPDAHATKEEIYENLMAGRISALDEKLAALGQTENDYLPSEIEKFKDATGYEEWLDFDPKEVKAMLDEPDHSRVDDMLAFAEKAEREYAAEAAAYVQTPADIAEQARAVYGEPEKLTVLVVEPMKEPYVKEIDPGLESLQTAVDGDIQAVYPYDDPVALICNEEGKMLGMELNRGLRDDHGTLYDVVAGTFLVVGLGDENFASLSPEMIQKYTEQFKIPEMFIQVNGKIVSIPVPAPEQDKAHLPDRFETDEHIQTPRGSFAVTDMSREQMEAAGYGYHHSSDDGKYLIMGNGTRAFAIPADQPEKDNPLRTAEMTIEDDYGMIDGVINNGRRGEELEKAKETTEKRPSIRERLEDAKRECAERPKPEKQHSGRNTPEHGDL